MYKLSTSWYLLFLLPFHGELLSSYTDFGGAKSEHGSIHWCVYPIWMWLLWEYSRYYGIWIKLSLFILLLGLRNLVFCMMINLYHRHWGSDCFEAHPSTWLNRKYTGEHKQRKVCYFFIFHVYVSNWTYIDEILDEQFILIFFSDHALSNEPMFVMDMHFLAFDIAKFASCKSTQFSNHCCFALMRRHSCILPRFW